MTTIINGSSPSITFSDNTTQSTAALPLTGGNVTGNVNISGSVGVGTTSPTNTLQVAGGISATGSAPAFQASAAIIDVSAGVARINATGADNSTNGTMTFNTASANAGVFNERMRIESSGNLLVGQTATGLTTATGLHLTSSANQQIGFRNSSTGSGRYWGIGMDGSSNFEVYAYTSSGSTLSGGAYLGFTSTSWAAASDERHKDIIEPITNAVDKVSNLRAVIGKYKTDEEGTRRSFLIAQDLQNVLPECVDDSNAERLAVRYTEVIPLLVAAIKELNAKVDAQATTIAELQAKAG